MLWLRGLAWRVEQEGCAVGTERRRLARIGADRVLQALALSLPECVVERHAPVEDLSPREREGGVECLAQLVR